MFKNPYETDIGMYLAKGLQSTTDEIMRYIIQNGNMSYEYNGKSTSLTFITGKNQEEKEFKSFPIPIVIKDHKDNTHIITDLKEFTKPTEDFDTLESILSRKAISETDINLALIIDHELDAGDFNRFKVFYYKTLQLVIANSLGNSLSLDQYDLEILNIVVLTYLVAVVEGGKDSKTKEFIVMNNMALMKTELATIEKVHNTIDANADTIDGLIKNIKTSSETNRLRNLTKESFLTTVGGVVFGTDRLKLILGLEYPPAWIALVNTYASNRLYERSVTFNVIKKFKRLLDVDDFLQEMKNLKIEYTR